MAIKKKSSSTFLPDKEIRQSQLISPWGVGAMIDFPGSESLMVCGLDLWKYSDFEGTGSEFKVTEERLQKRLSMNHFRLPPDFRSASESTVNPNLTIPSVRFPEWHFCEWCGAMKKLSLFGSQHKCSGRDFSKGRSCAKTPEKKRRYMVPLRFIAACEKGHIRDFPWMDWVHRSRPIEKDCELRLWTGNSASLSGLMISCSCEERPRSMAGAFNQGALNKVGVYCGGQQPWLGDTNEDIIRCGRELKVLQKGGSNVFFPLTVSSIYLPLWAEETTKNIIDALENPSNWKKLTSSTVDGELDEVKCRNFAEFREFDPEQFLIYARKKFAGESLADIEEGATHSEEEFRQDEYTALLEGRGDPDSHLTTRLKDTNEYQSVVKQFLSNITLVDQLRETKVFVGFSRVVPANDYKFSDKINLIRIDPEIDWLPASIVYGEGIFFKLNEDLVNAWSLIPSVIERVDMLARKYHKSLISLGAVVDGNIPPKFVLLHTLAHLLINQFSFDCGYGSSSLRERIYCDSNNEHFTMTGILIYTASGDSEGTMGGLVRQGKEGNFENIFVRALKNALWCSSDPICIESKGQGPGSCNLAACHSCALLPETSCEKGNKLLDRALLIGTSSNPELGFFSKFMDTLKT